jgi:glycosyltransferase involved in cell wall biosynthesis
MKQAMWTTGLNPVVVPNGIPKILLNRIDTNISAQFRKGIGSELILAKIARWDPDKRWNMAVEATARLKARGLKTTLIARGGMEGYGEEVIYNAHSLGLRIKDVYTQKEDLEGYLSAIINSSEEADFLNLKFHCPQELLRIIYNAADSVLANSGREPFGLVGLETMAAGGIAFTGSTGEDYAIPFHNAIVLETADAKEIETYVMYLASHTEEQLRIRKAAKYTAGRFIWEQIIENLIQRLEYQAKTQGLISIPRKVASEKNAYLFTPFAKNGQIPVTKLAPV